MSGIEILVAVYVADLTYRLGAAALRSEWLRDFFSPGPPNEHNT